MRLRTRTWLVICVLSLVGAAIFWRLGEQRSASRRAPVAPGATSAPVTPPATTLDVTGTPATLTVPPAALRASAEEATTTVETSRTGRDRLRLRNSDRPVDELARDDRALLLRNAFLDTSVGTTLDIPEHLRAAEEPGSFIVQSAGPITDAFRAAVTGAGGTLVSYLPNNAFLVRASRAEADTLRGHPAVSAVLPFEPYFKLEPELLSKAVEREPLEPRTKLSLTLLPGTRDAAVEDLQAQGAEVLAEFRTPFGPGLVVEPAGNDPLVALARLPEVQGIELHRQRRLLNDLARSRMGISGGTNTPGVFTNRLGLTGTNVFINVNDSGVDDTHPDLEGRVTSDFPATLIDLDGHGTHVAATIAGSGRMSGTVSNTPPGSEPGADLRGMAPAAKLFALPIDLVTGPLQTDAYLQETAATNYYITQKGTNLPISNNSWGYIGATEYTTASASYDAAVRDALPEVSGLQPVLYVFAAGNEGFGDDDGQGGEPTSIRAPGTGKNVITVGALESPRNITNEVIYPDADGTMQTNKVFLAETDTDFQVASFSSRGNVEPGVEGLFGRFKPDVVAPGTFIASARSKDWVDPRAFFAAQVNRLEGEVVTPFQLRHYPLLVPPDASEFRIRLLPNFRSPNPFPGLPIYLSYGDLAQATDLINSNNLVRVPPDATLQEGLWFYAVGNQTYDPVSYDIQTVVLTTNDFGSYFDELKKLNDGLGPNYRYESGTSMAAPAVTGLLALFQDYFQRENRKVTPALMKALLINGARSVGSLYNFSVRDVLNIQGWGVVNLTNSLPAGEIGSPTGAVHAIQFADHTGTNALVTGETRTWNLEVSPAAQDQILKVTLVWTDPPGNPNAGIKLVNNLDLVLREGTNAVYGGNDIPYRSDYTEARLDEASVTNDIINNVENIVLRPPLSTNYTLTVHARRVNVNAVPDHPNGVAQDFALAVSLENPGLTNALTVTPVPPPTSLGATPLLIAPTNGIPLLRQRVGANPPRYGNTAGDLSQWNFYVFTNLQAFTPENIGLTNGSNVAFITFIPPNLSLPRNRDADIDLYVSRDPQLTNLAPAVVESAFKSRRVGGTEMVAFTNAPLGDVFYVGVKSEDQQAAEFGFVAISSDQPFEEDQNGVRFVRGLPVNVAIPDGSPDQPSAAYVFGIVVNPLRVQEVTVTNTLAFDSTGDILVNLAHNDGYVVLNNHALDPAGRGGVYTAVYDDSNSGAVGIGSLFGRPSDGPGSLQSFLGEDGTGPWILSVTDNALTQTATNVLFTMSITPALQEDETLYVELEPNSARTFAIDVPSNATNLLVAISEINPNVPLFVALRRGEVPTVSEWDKSATMRAPGGVLTLGTRDVPPLNPGRYYLTIFNLNAVRVGFKVRWSLERELNAEGQRSYGSGLPLVVPDVARSESIISVPDDREIADLRVGLRVDHPRVSDLVFHLTSPQGVRLLVAENRGGTNGTAYGATLPAGRIFTTFPLDTNLARLAIKDGVAPFTNNAVTSTASNRIVFADGFELATPGAYSAGQAFAPGWTVLQGNATVVRTPAGSTNVAEGIQYVILGQAPGSSIATNIVLSPGQAYRVRYYAGKTLAGTPQGIMIYHNGILLQDFKGDSLPVGWYQVSFSFRAAGRLNLIEFRTPSGRAPLAIDAISLEESDQVTSAYYIPEEPLKPFAGLNALGDWKLEVADTLEGPVSDMANLTDWRLEFTYAIPTINAIRLTNDVPYYGSIVGTNVQFFYVEVPLCATVAENMVAGDFGTLLLFGDRDGLPIADLNSFQDDYGPYLNVEPGGIASFTLTTNSPAPAPLVPGQRYYMAVRNYQPDLTNNAYGIRVRFDCEDPPLPVVPSLTNGVPVLATIDPGPGLQYYQLIVSSNAVRADFELVPGNGNVDMWIRYGRTDDYPLPSPSLFDYKADDPDPTVTDLVSIDRTSPPVPLTPGVWYVAVRNGETFPVNYTLTATETYVSIINLTNAVAYTNTIGAVDPAIGLTGADLQYYAFLVSSNSVRARFETFGADGDVNLYVRRGLPIPTPLDFHFASRNPGVLEESIAVTNTTTPIWLTPGWWYLSVENADVTNVTYAIQATEVPGVVIPLSNDVAFTNAIAPGELLDYYSFQVSPEALSADFEVYGMSDDVQLLLRPGLPLPTFNDFAYASTNAGLADEAILLTPFSFPVNLTPGTWHLGVANASTNLAQYIVKAKQETAQVIPLTNGIPYNASLAPAAPLAYFQFEVTTNAVAAEFKLTSAGAGDLDLFLRKGPPLPGPGNALFVSTNAGPVDELIRVDTNSVPVPLSPGIWYLAVTNKEAFPVGYEVTATEFGLAPPPVSGLVTNIAITPTNICVTWVSVPGTNYWVGARTNALDAAWTPVSPTVLAVNTSTTWCLEPPGPWRFFEVFEGDSPLAPIPAPVPILRLDGANICVAWASVPGTNYFVEAKKSSTDANWVVLTPLVTATGTTLEECYPLDWGYRFFRVGVGDATPPEPKPLPAEEVAVMVTVDEICLSWTGKNGVDYLVEGKRTVDDTFWTVVSEPLRGTGATISLCFDGATGFRYFRVIEGVTVPQGPPPSVPVPNVSLSVDAAFQLCLTWDTLLGAEYFVEAKQRISDPAWTVISPLLQATSVQLSYCQPLGSPWRYLQVRRVNSPPSTPLVIDAIEMTAQGPVIHWTAPPGLRYQVFVSEVLPPLWVPLGQPVTSVTGDYLFPDQSGLPGPRFYRVEQLP